MLRIALRTQSTLLATVRLSIPELSLVVLVGPSGSGKSTFARRHFKPTEVLSSDTFRALVSDDENDQTATEDAFEVLYHVGRKRLGAGRLVVLDATNVQPTPGRRRWRWRVSTRGWPSPSCSTFRRASWSSGIATVVTGT